MATYLFTDIADFKRYVGGGANVSLELDSIAPTMLDAAQHHVLPWLGEELWGQLVAAVAAGPVDPATPLGALLPHACRPLAKLTMYEYAAIGGIQFGESGIHRVETEDMKAAYKYQEQAYRDSMLQHGYESLEQMQRFLDNNAADYATWLSGAAGQRARALVINYAWDLRTVYSKYVSRYTFEMLRSVIADLELFVLVPTIGQAQYDRLKAGILADDLTDLETGLLQLVQKAVGNFAIEEGLRRHWVTIQGNNVVQVVHSGNDDRKQVMPAADTGTSLKILQAEEYANRYLSRIVDYLTTHITDFPDYKAFLDAQAALAAAEAAAETDARAGDYGCSMTSESTAFNTHNNRRGISRL